MNPVTRMNLIASLLVGLSVTANADVITDARLWELTGPGLHNPRQLAATKKLDVLDNAHLFALHAMAMADSFIAFRPKFHRGRKEGRQQQWSLAI
jgi:hypothetical protein